MILSYSSERIARKKLEELRRRIKERGAILVAFSGGVDSGFLLSVAHEAQAENVMAVTIDSELFPKRELEHAKGFLNHAGITYKIIPSYPLRNEDFAMNPYNRCYYCKKFFSQILKDVAAEEGITTIAEGVTLSDFDEYRPGIAASEEEGIWHPMAEVGIRKLEVRQMAKEMGLPFWDKPSNSCLATRIEYGERITVDKLEMIAAAENFLMDNNGFRQVRVRWYRGAIARIEVDKHELKRFFDTETRDNIVKGLKKLGFNYVSIDLEGYRSGSMGENSKHQAPNYKYGNSENY